MRRIGFLALALAVSPTLSVAAGAAGREKPPKQFGLGSLEVWFLANNKVIPIHFAKGGVQRGRPQPLDKGQRSPFAVDLVDIWTPAHMARIMEGRGRNPSLTTFVMLDDDCLKSTDVFKDYPEVHFFLAPAGSPLRDRLSNPGNYTCKGGKCSLDWDSFDFEKKNPPFE